MDNSPDVDLGVGCSDGIWRTYPMDALLVCLENVRWRNRDGELDEDDLRTRCW
jgi:hypothetical protein